MKRTIVAFTVAQLTAASHHHSGNILSTMAAILWHHVIIGWRQAHCKVRKSEVTIMSFCWSFVVTASSLTARSSAITATSMCHWTLAPKMDRYVNSSSLIHSPALKKTAVQQIFWIKKDVTLWCSHVAKSKSQVKCFGRYVNEMIRSLCSTALYLQFWFHWDKRHQCWAIISSWSPQR